MPDMPKPMAPISGRPFLEYQIDYWKEQGVDNIILSVGYLHNKIVNHFGHVYNGLKIEYVIEKSALGTGGALLMAVKKSNLKEPFLAINGDTYFEVELKILKEFAQLNNTDWCIALYRSRDTQRYMGLEVSVEGRVTAFNSSSNCRPLINGGVYWINPLAIESSKIPSGNISLENEMLPKALSRNQNIYGVEFTGDFIDIGVPDDYGKAKNILNKK